MALNEQYNYGFVAFWQGYGLDDNPHVYGCVYWEDWRIGWIDASN